MFAVSIRAVNKDGASRFTNTIDNRFAVIGNFTAGHVTLAAADIIHYGRNVQYIAACHWWGVVGHQHKIIRFRTGVARFIRCGGGDMVLTFWQRCGWRELPGAVVVRNRRTNMLTVVINIDTAARLCRAVEGWVCVVGGAAVAQIATNCSYIIRCGSQYRFFRGGRINGNIKGRRGHLVSGRIFGNHGQAVIAIGQILFRSEGPVAVRIHHGGAQYIVAIHDGHGAAWLTFTAQFRTCVIGHGAWLQVAHDRPLIIHHFTHGNLVWIRIDGEGDPRRRFTGVARRIGYGGGDLMIAFSQRLIWRIGPFTFVINDDGTDLLVVVIDVHHAARLGFAAQGRGLIVGGVAWTYRPLLVAHVIIDNDIFCRRRCRSVNHDREAAAGARVARCVSRCDGEGVLAIRQRSIRGERPLPVAVRRDGTNHFPVVEDRHNVARCSAAAQGWGGVVGGFAFLHWTDVRLGVVHNAVDGRCSTHRDQQIDVVRRCFTGNAVARRVLRLQGQLVQAFRQWGFWCQAPGAITAYHRCTNQVFAGRVGGVDKDGVPGFTDTTDERFAVIGDVTAGYIALTIAYVIRNGGNIQNIC